MSMNFLSFSNEILIDGIYVRHIDENSLDVMKLFEVIAAITGYAIQSCPFLLNL